ncbi:MAG TPA: LamG-like jellyroll fold domain-containing protein, partial [Candidatus Angelobacter sp.]|nr:LamG-like jellyroll fold domain-containing protein [Candidatus Angelobacter sp.]
MTTATVTATDPNNPASTANALISLVAPPMTLLGVTPSSGSAVGFTFAVSGKDDASAGIANNAPVAVGLQFNPTGQALLNSGVCRISYSPGQTGAGISNLVFLQNDDGSFSANNWGAPGSNQVLSNSQCSVNLLNTLGGISGDTITLTVPVTFRPGFSGPKTIYENVWDSGFEAGWSQVGSWNVPAGYVGCYTDDGNRALPTALSWGGETVESCRQKAATAGFIYAGVQYYGQCFGGNSAGYSQTPDTDCNTPCTANPAEMCGGPWRNSIYQASASSPVTLSVAISGNGTVTTNPMGINCSGNCSANFSSGTSVTLTATPSAGSVFAGWSGGGCSGTGSCTVTMNANTTINAAFNPAASVSISPATASVQPRQTVTLTSNMNANWSLSGSGSLSTTGPSTSTTFTPPLTASSLTMTVTATNPNNPSNTASATINLVAPPMAPGGVQPANGSGNGPTVFTLSAVDNDVAGIGSNAAVSIGLEFSPAGQGPLNANVCQILFSPSLNGPKVFLQNDDGSFTANNWGPPGANQILANSQCSVNLAGTSGGIVNGNTITLSVPVTFTSSFAGAKTVYEAYWDSPFNIPYNAFGTWTVTSATETLSIGRNGSGSGTVTGSAGNINCGPSCSASLPSGTSVTLTASPDTGSYFAGWFGGGCSGTGSCVVALNAATTVTATFNASNPNNLVAHWSFDEGGGTLAGDSSGSGVNGTIVGATWTSGVLGSALQFDGVSSYVGITINVPETEYTFSGWFRTPAPNGPIMAVVDPASPNAGAYDRLLGLQGGRVCHRVWAEETYCSPGAYNDNTWHLATVTVGSTGGHLYVDGVLVANGNKTSSDFYWQTGMTIGNHFSWGAFAGTIDDVRVYNRVLSAAEIAALHASTLSVTFSGSGSGTVVSSPAGINYASSCSAGFITGSVVTLSATPGAGSVFAGWSGSGCSGTGSCTVAMNAAASVNAAFNRVSVSISPTSATVQPRQTVTLTSNMSVNWNLSGSGSLSTTGPSTSTTFTPPLTASSFNMTVTAINPNNASDMASAAITLVSPPMSLGGVQPANGSSNGPTLFRLSAVDNDVAGIGSNAAVSIGLEFSPAGQGPLNANVCQIMFSPSLNGPKVFLQNDDGSFTANNWGPPGANQILANSQCSVNLAGTSGGIVN